MALLRMYHDISFILIEINLIILKPENPTIENKNIIIKNLILLKAKLYLVTIKKRN